MQFESRDGHLRAQYQTDAQGQEQLLIYDHQGNLLDVLCKVEGPAPAVADSPSHTLMAGGAA
jgi:hypothetical protein